MKKKTVKMKRASMLKSNKTREKGKSKNRHSGQFKKESKMCSSLRFNQGTKAKREKILSRIQSDR